MGSAFAVLPIAMKTRRTVIYEFDNPVCIVVAVPLYDRSIRDSSGGNDTNISAMDCLDVLGIGHHLV